MKQSNPEVIDVYNDEQMRNAGFLRPVMQQPRDPYVWTKTNRDRKLLKKYKVKMVDGHFHTVPEKISSVPGRLTVQLVSNKVFPKNTYSHYCTESDIAFILKKYKNYIKKASWNGVPIQ